MHLNHIYVIKRLDQNTFAYIELSTCIKVYDWRNDKIISEINFKREIIAYDKHEDLLFCGSYKVLIAQWKTGLVLKIISHMGKATEKFTVGSL